MKKKPAIHFLLIALLCLFPRLVFAEEIIKFEKVDMGSNRSLGAGFIQDRDGFFWIGSQPGLNKWNGSGSMVYMSSVKGISDNTITAIIQDKKDRIWIGTMDGLNVYDKSTDKFTQLTHDPDNPNSLSHESIGSINQFQSLIEDKEGSLWIATQNGLNRFNPENREFSHFKHDAGDRDSISDNTITAIFEDSFGTLWVGTRDGLNKLNKENNTFLRYRHDPKNQNSLSHNEVYSIGEDDFGNIWIGTESGLNKLSRNSDSFIRFYNDKGQQRIIADNKVTSISKDKKGRLWMCHYTKGSVTLFDPGTETFQYFIHDSDTPGGLPANDVKYVYEGRQGIIWFVSTTGGNVYKYDPNGQKFVTFTYDPEDPLSLNGNSVLPIYEDTKGVVWIGTDKSKLNKFNKTTGDFTYIPIEGYHPYAFFEDSEGVFWIGETTGRLSIFDRATQTYIKSYEGFSSSFITHIAQDSKDKSLLWITTHKDGLVKFNIKTEEVTHYRHNNNDKYSLSHNSIWGFYQEADTLWLGTWGGGLNKFNKKDERVTVYKHNPKDPGTITSNVCGNILVTSQGQLFISTLGGGLNQFNREDQTFTHYNTANGLFPSDNLEGLLEDENGNLWVASSTEEIIKFNIRTKAYRTYGQVDGIEIGGPWFVANHKSPDGQMWFGGPKGVTAFYPGKIKSNGFKPPVYITSLTQGGESIGTDSALERLTRINLSWRKPFFEFKAAALNYTRPQHNRYKYKLVGWDNEWFNSGVHRIGRYSNLRGGTYTLRIAAANNDGVWCTPEQEAALKIVVSSPFWETPRFKFLSIFLVLAVIVFVVVYFQKLRSEIKERGKAKKDLMASEKKYRDLIDSTPDLRYQTDLNGRIVFVSKSVSTLSGYSVEEVIGMKMAEEIYVYPDERENFLQTLQKKGFITDFEAQLKHKNGSIWWASTNAHFRKDEDGSIIGVEGVTRDITQRKKMEARLLQAQKIESIGNLAGGIAHDFNNILVPIIGRSEILLEDLPDNSFAHENAQEIFQAARRAGDLVSQILTFSRQSEHKMTPVGLQNILKEVLKLSRSTIPSNIEIHESIQQDCGLVMADPTQIHQIAMNLITNAFHAVQEKNGTIDIELKQIDLKGNEIPGSALQPGQYDRLSVSDNGIGMSQDTIHNIFEPYFTTKEQGKGTGLGLAVVYGIVKEHKGEIKVYSEVGKGTTFNVYLPLMEKSSKIVTVDTVERAATGTESILLVDDEVPVAKLEGQMLSRLGYQVVVKTDSQDALNAFRSDPDSFDLIISDMTMPGITGDQLSKKILSIKPNTPIIICTGFSEKINKEQAEIIGVKGFLMKPVVKSDMAKMVRKVLDQAKSDKKLEA